MTRHSHLRGHHDVLTYDELIRLWQSYDEPLTPEELRQLRRRRTPDVLIVARGLAAIVFLTVLVGLPPLLRTVGA